MQPDVWSTVTTILTAIRAGVLAAGAMGESVREGAEPPFWTMCECKRLLLKITSPLPALSIHRMRLTSC